MDAFELLKTDHKKVAELFKQIENGSGQKKSQLFAQLKSELDVHAHIEEVIFYPALENKEESRDITLEAYEEHKVVKDLLAALASDSPDEEWDAKLTVLKENVEHHVDEEEGELFSKARKVLSDDQIESLGNDMEAEKARQRGAGSPAKRRASSPNAKGSRPATATKSTGNEKPGVLKRLANFVGLGSESSAANKRPRKAGKATKAKASSKTTKGGAGKASKKAGSSKSTKAGKGSQKTGNKTGAAKSAKASQNRSGGKKSSRRAGSSNKGRGAAAKKRGRTR